MNTLYILIIVGAVCLVAVFVGILLVKRKKMAKAKPDATTQPEPIKKDEDFKIARKSKTARVSKKALESDSRSARVERVFERESDNQAEAEVQVDDLDKDSKALVDAISTVASEGRKVVSIGELARQAKIDETGDVEQTLKGQEITPSASSEKLEEEFDAPSFLAGLRAERNQSNVHEKPKDFADVIEMDAILNPKFKNKK